MVVPEVEADGSINPANNRYYAATREDIQWDYEKVPGSGSDRFTRQRRNCLDRTDPLVKNWEEYVTRDVGMAHDARRPSTPTPFGTFLVNMAAFFNKKRP